MKIIPHTSVGIEAAGPDLRVAVVREFAGARRLLRMDKVAGFASLSDDDKAAALAAHFKQHKLSGYNVHLTLPGGFGVVRDLEFPATVGAADALRSAVALQVENLSPWALDEMYWDCSWEPPLKGSRSIVVHVGIVPRTVLDSWIALFGAARLALTGVSLSSLSWAHGVTVFWGKERPAMIVAAENDYIESALVSDDRIYALNMPCAEPAQGLPACMSQLMRAGRLESADQLRLVTYGGAGAVAGLESTPVPVEGAAEIVDGFGAVSTALLGLLRSGFRLNLIPPQLRYQRNYLQLIPTYALLGLLVLLGVFVWVREPYQQSLYAQQLDQEGKRLAAEVRPVADQEARLNQISDRLKTLDGLMRGKDQNLEALREVSRVLPQGTFLISYSCQDNVMTIAGFSDSAASIQKLIEDSPVFRDAQFASSITRDVAGRDRFTLRASIEVRP
jgi:Tfp pilus assembly protein PilN